LSKGGTAPWPPRPVTLESETVRLEPLAPEHAPALRAAAADGRLWELWFTSVPTADGTDGYIGAALAARDRGTMLPFVVRHRASGEIIGSTRYCNIEADRPRLEIGYTWYAKRFQKSAVNTECKLLLLSHAFESLGCLAVEFRTNWFNFASREAIAKLGAKQDGVLRSHMLNPDGSLRDTVVFSHIAPEWPGVRKHLQFRLQRLRGG
jgi:RimJ/RimL family protein N-acetyltransferase